MRAGPNPTTRSVALRCVPRVVLMHGVGGGGARARKPSTSPAQTVTSTSNAATGISQSSSHVSQNVAAFEQGPRKQTSTAAARNKGKPKATNDSETSDHLESLCTTLITRASAFAPLGAPKAGRAADTSPTRGAMRAGPEPSLTNPLIQGVKLRIMGVRPARALAALFSLAHAQVEML